MDAKSKEIAEQITNYLNSFSNKSQDFNQAMSRQHRTLQQNFTKLCLGWLEHCASPEYGTDGRNEQSQEIAKVLLDGFRKVQESQGFTDTTLDMMSKPSGHLGCI
jgi:hypothetical protein